MQDDSSIGRLKRKYDDCRTIQKSKKKPGKANKATKRLLAEERRLAGLEKKQPCRELPYSARKEQERHSFSLLIISLF